MSLYSDSVPGCFQITLPSNDTGNIARMAADDLILTLSMIEVSEGYNLSVPYSEALGNLDSRL